MVKSSGERNPEQDFELPCWNKLIRYTLCFNDLLWSNSNALKLIFLMLALFVEYIFLATFYGPYFNHQFFLHIALYNFSSSYSYILSQSLPSERL